MDLDYVQNGDYLLPAIKLNDPPDAPPLGRYGMLHKLYLREHRPMLCREIDEVMAHRLAVISDRTRAEKLINELCCHA